ncbi:PREDICTED: uncharacterized protein LOC106113592 [Papilio xuthus]|uniref:Uncharacterized protein LOC106113592 n=1 Tax=Papilio xuthus TaxID=66420 RepID=A0AAJ7E412_PAPXU|nr:PREDICTED: uncharacterized protein LOC106113592 [Papilio xuthus]
MVVLYGLLFCTFAVAAEHSGAYSSPQYAKKMFPKKSFDTSILLPQEKPPIPFNRASIDRFDSLNDTTQYGRSSFLDSAGNLLSNAGGQVVSSLAKDFIARSTGSSQVLSLNLTNLVILIILKALILAAGFFGAGAWKGNHYGRSIDENKNATYLTEDEVLLYLSYLRGEQSKDYGCLYRLACQKPRQGALYASAAELTLQGAKLLQGNNVDLDDYENIYSGIKQASTWGEDGKPCDKIYKCA